jgi:hypothetical protein
MRIGGLHCFQDSQQRSGVAGLFRNCLVNY